jgi:hypothetical protein
MIYRLAFLSAFSLSAAVSAQSSAPPFTYEETGQTFWRLQDAVKAVGGGDGTIAIAPGAYRQCAVVERGTIVFRAVTAGTVIFDSVTCEGKATFVLRGTGAEVDGIIFQNMRVPDRNGSGIRLEKGNLKVVNAIFRNSEQGILTANDPAGAISIDRSTFSGLGGCPDGMCSHSIYIGDYGKLSVTRSRFERGTGGHYVKSRAARAEITDSSFDDTKGHETNYMIDLPAGSVGVIARNEFVQGVSKENYSAFIAVGAEGINHPSQVLSITNNRASIAPGANRQTIFVADWTHEPLRISANQLGAGLRAFEER